MNMLKFWQFEDKYANLEKNLKSASGKDEAIEQEQNGGQPKPKPKPTENKQSEGHQSLKEYKLKTRIEQFCNTLKEKIKQENRSI